MESENSDVDYNEKKKENSQKSKTIQTFKRE